MDTTDPNDTATGQQPTWRTDATRVILLVTDASFHKTGEGSGWPGDAECSSVASMVGILNSAGIKVIGLAPYPVADLTELATGTGGTVQDTGATGDEIAAAILAGLGNLPVTVSMASDAT